MVRVYKGLSLPKRVSLRKGRKFGPNRASVNVTVTLTASQNAPSDATSIQSILAAHFPGSVQSWNGVSYKIISGRELVNMVNLAFQNTLQLKITGVKVYGQSDSASTLMAGFRQSASDHLRIVSGIGRVRATFNYKDRQAPQHIVLIGETTTSFKITFYYDRNLATSHI